jgi:uncharacterized protein (DUF1015 family)
MPFKAMRYNRIKVRDISRVVSPPYDVIPKKIQDGLYRKDPHNIVRLILNKITSKDNAVNNRYTRSKRFFDAWIKKGILRRDDTDSFYIYTQIYKKGKKEIAQIGFIGLMALEMGHKEQVLPHENTLAAPKKDRLNLTRAVKANLEPIFILHDDSAVTKAVKRFSARNRPVIDIRREGVRHLVWKMDDPAAIALIKRRMKGKNVFIADGHHRYEVARMYSKEARCSAAKYVMVYFVEADEKMLTVLPTHRLIKDIGKLRESGIIDKLRGFFHVVKVGGVNKMVSVLNGLSSSNSFGMYLGKGGYYILRLKDLSASDRVIRHKPKDWKHLDVSILHLFVFQRLLGIEDVDDNIGFSKDPREATKAVDSGAFKAAFFLNPTKASQVKRIARLGERMPRKSTYFYPKQLSGLVINKH